MIATRDSSADRLDVAIDHVAARLVQVREDEELAMRIASALPDRSSRFGWMLPQFGALAVFAVAAVVWTMRDDAATPSLSPLPSSDVVALTGVPTTVVAIQPGTALRTPRLEPLEPMEPLEPLEVGPDFERSLAPIAPMTALAVSDLSPSELPAPPALAPEPIAIADLPLTAESFPPR